MNQLTEDKLEAIELLRHGIFIIRTADAEALTDHRHELHGEVRSFLDTHCGEPLYDGRNLTTILEDVGLPRFPWRCDYERHLRVFEHSRKPYPEAVDSLIVLAQRWISVAEKYLHRINDMYGTSFQL